jgi:hypothetical protein
MKDFNIRDVATMTCSEFANIVHQSVKIQRLAALRREVAQLTVELAIADAKNQDASK